jgi:hypothetical protein
MDSTADDSLKRLGLMCKLHISGKRVNDRRCHRPIFVGAATRNMLLIGFIFDLGLTWTLCTLLGRRG